VIVSKCRQSDAAAPGGGVPPRDAGDPEEEIRSPATKDPEHRLHLQDMPLPRTGKGKPGLVRAEKVSAQI